MKYCKLKILAFYTFATIITSFELKCNEEEITEKENKGCCNYCCWYKKGNQELEVENKRKEEEERLRKKKKRKKKF